MTDGRQRESLERQVEHMLDEARMILPGIQTLFGFQLIAVFNDSFSRLLAPDVQLIHLAALITVLAACGAVIAPAAYHRLAEPHTISEHFVTITCRLLSAGLVLLMIGLSLDVFVIGLLILRSLEGALALAAAVCLGLGAMWFAFPLASRHDD